MSDQAKKTDAWMPLWIGDYLADTMSLNTAQHGAYLLLLVAYWRNKGPLQDDDEDLATTVRATPAEWKKLRPKMLKFFDAEDGMWVHNRADKELQRAGLFAKKAHDRAVKAAAARWGSKDGKPPPEAPPQEMLGACTEDASSIAQAVLNRCPTPSPSPGIGIHTDVAKEVIPPHSPPQGGVLSGGTSAGQVCMAMKAEGIADVNPGHQTLLTLLQAGATTAEFTGAAREAARKTKGFAYALAIVANERKQAAELKSQVHHGPMPAPPPPPESAYARKMRETAEGLAPGIARRRPSPPAPTPLTVDMETTDVPAIARH